MFVKSYCSSISGIEAVTVAVEVNITAGIGMYLVGLPDNAVRESQERIRAAFENCEYKMSGKKVVVNLSPADLRKEGSAYDLPIAVAMLAASGQPRYRVISCSANCRSTDRSCPLKGHCRSQCKHSKRDSPASSYPKKTPVKPQW